MSRKKNRFKEEARKEPESVLRKGSRGVTGFLQSVNSWIRDPRTRKVFGGFLLLLTVYLAIAFVSYLFTWHLDQDKVTAPSWWEFLFDPEVRVENWLGKLGALLSHFFIHNWFGISAFLFIPILFLLGVKVLFRISLLSLRWTLPVLVFLMFWGSAAFSFFFQEELLFLGGAFGHQLNTWLHALLGRVGTAFLLLFLFGGFLIYSFDPSLSQLFGKKKEEAEPEGADAANAETATEERTETPEPEGSEGGTEDASAPPTPPDAMDPEQEAEPSEEADAAEGVVIDHSKEKGDEENERVETEAGKEEEGADKEQEVSHEEGGAEEAEDHPEEAQKERAGEEVAGPEEEGSEAEVGTNGFSVAVAEGDQEATEEEIRKKNREFGEYDPRLDLPDYQMPPLDLLDDHGTGEVEIDKDELAAKKDQIVKTLGHHKIEVSQISATVGPTLTLYEIQPAPGVKVSRIKNLEDDITLSLAAKGVRIIAPIPGRGTVGIEVPNAKPQVVGMRTLIASEKFQNSDMELPMALGKTIQNETYMEDLTQMPHLLMAGATGQGKSVGLNVILASLLYKRHPSQVKFVLVDPKKVELTLFHKIERHFLAQLPDEDKAIVSEISKVVTTLKSLCEEMDQRYKLLEDAQVRNVKEYNRKFIQRRLNPENGHRYLPYIVLVVDEFADLIMTAGKDVEHYIARLAQLARAIGIHLIIATQRPSVKVITGLIKANFPARIAFRVTSQVDSRTILDAGGAEQLIGKGDMLLSTGSDPVRLQCAFLDTPEVEKVTEHIGEQRGYMNPYLLPEVDEGGEATAGGDDEERDALFEEAAKLMVQHQQGSTSLIQRKLKLGYNRAGRIMDQLENAGVVGPFEGSRSRKVMIPDEESLERFLSGETPDPEN